MTTTRTSATTTHVVLVPGHWLAAWAWDGVLPALREAGLTPHPVTLPGQDPDRPGRTDVTLVDHVAHVRELVDSLDGDVVLVGHSGGAPVVQTVVDQRPERVRRVVYLDAGPLRDGVVLFPGAPDDASVPFPDDAALEQQQLSAEGVDLAELRARAVPQPGGVMAAPVHVTDERRLAVPVTVVGTSMPGELVRQLAEAGQLPTDLLDHADVTYVDLPTGHWPMLSRPADLGAVLATEARR